MSYEQLWCVLTTPPLPFLQQLDQLVQRLPAPHAREGCLLVGDLNILPNEVLQFLSRYKTSHGARAVTHDGRLDTYVSFPEEGSQVRAGAVPCGEAVVARLLCDTHCATHNG